MINASPISKSSVLSATSGGLEFYRFVIPALQVYGNKARLVCNPFYPDSKPSLSIFFSDGQWLFNDFGDPSYKGDVFNFAGHFYNLDTSTQFHEILTKMDNDLFLNLSSPASYPVSPFYYGIPAHHAKSKATNHSASVKLRSDFLDFELDYWSKYNITLDVLSRYNVCPVDVLEPSPGFTVRSTLSNPVYAYSVCEGVCKIYQPLNTKYKFQWIGSHPSSWYFGYEQLPSSGQLVFITGGEKDVLTLASLSLPAFTLNSETATLPPELVEELSARFENIIVLYDMDETGMAQSEKLCRTYGLTRWLLPQWLADKGGKDISDYIALGGDIERSDILAESFEVEVTVTSQAEQEIVDLGKLAMLARITQVRSANERLTDAATMPPIKRLLDIFFHTGELAILFADTGVGKSVFAVSAADAIARGTNFMGLTNDASPQTVLYYDFELSDKQFQKRYSDESGKLYDFSPNLFVVNLRNEESENLSDSLSFDDILFYNIERDILEKQAKVVIIDNLTFLKTQPMQEQDTALAVMKKLIVLKRKYDLSMLILAHTPKIYNTSPLTINHLQGSKHLSNFSDSVFCLGHSATDNSLRYLKQVKPSRSAELVYDIDNVIVCEIRKDNSLLTLVFRNYDSETNHLVRREDVNSELKERARQLRVEGKTIQQVAEALGKSKSTVDRWLKAQ